VTPRRIAKKGNIAAMISPRSLVFFVALLTFEWVREARLAA
jgi:hypothetical protein